MPTITVNVKGQPTDFEMPTSFAFSAGEGVAIEDAFEDTFTAWIRAWKAGSIKSRIAAALVIGQRTEPALRYEDVAAADIGALYDVFYAEPKEKAPEEDSPDSESTGEPEDPTPAA